MLSLCVALNEGGSVMSAKASEYRRVNFDTICYANEIISMEDALKDVTPVGSFSKMEITKAEKDYEDKCVKLEISY